MEVGFFDYLCNQLLFSKIVTMILVRELIYKDKTLDDFNIDSDESIFKLFFDIILKIEGFNAWEYDKKDSKKIVFKVLHADGKNYSRMKKMEIKKLKKWVDKY